MLDRLRQFLTGRGLVFVPWLFLGASDVFADALHDQDPTFRATVSLGLWFVWAAVLIVLVIPGAGALVFARTAVPAAAPATVWALYAINGDRDAAQVATIGVAVVAAIAVLAPRVGERFIDAAGYGDERRFLLRPPAPVLFGMLIPTWAISVVGLTAGPLVLAGGRWLLGIVLIAVGLPLAIVALHALLRLAQRWLVFVPAGLVIHDHVAIAEPVLVQRRSIGLVGPARADTQATDLTADAMGLALEFQLTSPVRVALAIRRDEAEEQTINRFMVSPTRPAAVLSEASTRRMSIG